MPRLSTQFENFNLGGFNSTQSEKIKNLTSLYTYYIIISYGKPLQIGVNSINYQGLFNECIKHRWLQEKFVWPCSVGICN